MTESYQPYFESSEDKDEDKKDEKKNHKKRAALGNVSAQAKSEHEHGSGDRPQKLGGELLRPLSIELPKHGEPQIPEKEHEEKDGQPVHTREQYTEPTVSEQIAPDELQHIHDELAAATFEDEDDEDDAAENPKKKAPLAAEHKTDEQETPERAESESVTEGGDESARTEAAFQEITQVPELADLSELGSAETPTAEEGGPKIADVHQEMHSEGTPAGEDDDAIFNDIVESSLGGEAPGTARFYEQEPGEAPIDMDAGNSEPPGPPTIEGDRWDAGDNEPWGQAAGGLTNPNVVSKIDAIDARQNIDDLYHTSRENGLASAVGLLGLGLVLEHFAAKRRDKKLKRQLDVQSRRLKKTNRALQLEQQSHQTTRHTLERVHTAQTATAERVRRDVLPAVQGAEVAAIAVAGMAERNKTRPSQASEKTIAGPGSAEISPAQEKVLAERLTHSRELGRAIAKNPELQGLKEVHELKRSLEVANETTIQQEQQIDGLKREVNYEHLQSKYADNRGPSRSSGGGGAGDVDGMPVLPSPQQQLPPGIQADYLLSEHALREKKDISSASAIVPIAAVTIVIILAAVIVMVFGKL